MHRPPALASMSTRVVVLASFALAAFSCTIHKHQVRDPEPAPKQAPPAPEAADNPADEPQPVAEAQPAALEPQAKAEPKKKNKGKKDKDNKSKKKDEKKEAKGEAPPAEPKAAPPSEPPADPALQTIALPLRLPLSVVRAELEKRVPAKLARGWEPVTKPGDNPSIDAKITLWRDPVVLRIEGDVVHVEVPLRYAAEIRGKAKTPFGKSVSLANGQTWGTAAEPQRITLSGQARVAVSKDWELELKLALDPPKHGPVPDGSICTAGSFKLCVPKKTIAPVVREKLDAEITKRFDKLENKLAKDARDTVRLPKRVKTLWAMLGCAIPLDKGVKFDCTKGKAPKKATHWLLVDPVAADVTYRGDGDALVVELRMSARFERVEGKAPPRRELGPLPPRGAPAANAEPIELDAKLDVEDLRRIIRKRLAP